MYPASYRLARLVLVPMALAATQLQLSQRKRSVGQGYLKRVLAQCLWCAMCHTLLHSTLVFAKAALPHNITHLGAFDGGVASHNNRVSLLRVSAALPPTAACQRRLRNLQLSCSENARELPWPLFFTAESWSMSGNAAAPG